jgi:hypothetical protein
VKSAFDRNPLRDEDIATLMEKKHLAKLARAQKKAEDEKVVADREDRIAELETENKKLQRKLQEFEWKLSEPVFDRGVEGGVPLAAIAKNCETSVRKIERTYAKVLHEKERAFIENGTPSFGPLIKSKGRFH